MRLFPSQTRYPIEFAFLALLILFLPSFEAPKNIFWAAYVITWFVNRFRDKDFGGKWKAWDTLIVTWIASGYIVAAFAGFQHHEWLGANDILRYGSILWLVMRSRVAESELRTLLTITIASAVLALALGVWSLYVTHKTTALQLHSVGHVNHSAIYLAIIYGASLTLTLAYWKNSRALWQSLSVLVTATLAIALIISDSRAALGAGLILTLIIGLIWLRRSLRTVIALFAITLVAAGLAYFGQTSIIKKIESRIDGNNTLAGRIEIWNVAKEAWCKYPLFGVGMNNYGKISVKHVAQWRAERNETFESGRYLGNGHAHSLYFNTLAERGIFGFSILILVLLAWAATLARHLPRRDHSNLYWALWGGSFSAWFVTVGIGAFNTTLHHEHAILSMLLLGFWLSHLYRPGFSMDHPRESNPPTT